ncbi:MAG: NAD(P)H-dependent glycerol-3-phosphate dehydrogenase [Spirochaetota bacterium]
MRSSRSATLGKTVGIIGAGAWGTALGKVLAEHGHRAQIWAFEQDVTREIEHEHRNTRYLPDVTLPETLHASSDLGAVASDKEFLILATPSLHILPITRKLMGVPEISEGRTAIGVLTKGFIQIDGNVRLIVQTLEDYLPGFYKGNLVYISGPSHAEEVAMGKLTGLISASLNPKNAIKFRRLLNRQPLMVFSSLDVIGVQVAAAMKNVIAIAFGVMDALKNVAGAHFGDNTESLLLAAGLNEIQSLAVALGATHPETFTSIAGVGDLDVTCRSQYGRNRRFGREIVEKSILQGFESIDDLIRRIGEIGYLPEGVIAARGARELVGRHNVKLPITNAVYQILNREAEPVGALAAILKGLTGASFNSVLSGEHGEEDT